METQILSGKLVETDGIEDVGGTQLQWFYVETIMKNDDDRPTTFSCLAEGHNARHLSEIKIGTIVDLDGYFVLSNEGRGESSLWFDVKSIHYEKTIRVRL